MNDFKIDILPWIRVELNTLDGDTLIITVKPNGDYELMTTLSKMAIVPEATNHITIERRKLNELSNKT